MTKSSTLSEKYRGTLTAQQFTKASKETRMQVNSVNMAREVMVDSERTVQVAAKYNVRHQQVTQSCRSVYESHLMLNEIPKGWVEVKVYLPPGKAKEVEKMAKDLRKEHFKKK